MSTPIFTYRQPAAVRFSLFFNKLNGWLRIFCQHTHYSHARNPYLQVSVPVHAVLKVYGVDSERKTTKVASIWFDMNSYNQSFNQFVLNWKPDNWYQRYTFHAIEEDPGKDIKISIAANIGVKKTVGVMTVGAEAGISKEFYFSQPEDIGTADLSFYDPINTTLFFHKGKYGCYVTLGE